MRVTIVQPLLLPWALLACGCSEIIVDRVPVAGTVLIDGEPLAGGTIRFVPESGRPASSAIMPDGSFELASESVSRVSEAGIPHGKYRVQVSASNIVDDETIRWKVPEKYADFRTSGLEVTIDKPTDDLEVELTWDGAQPPKESDGSASTEDDSTADRGELPASFDGEPSSQDKGVP